MELHQIRYFIALCEELNFTRAAERCDVAQSSLTRAIKTLERELGGALFHREHANTHLSRLGQKVRPFLEQAQTHVEGAKRQAQDFIRAQAQSLRLGVMRSLAPAQVAELINALHTRHSTIQLQVVDAAGATLQERLIAGELDAAIYALPDLAGNERLNHLPLYREPLVVVLKAAHRLAGRQAIRISDLQNEPHLWRIGGEYEITLNTCPEAGAFASDRDDWVLAMVAAGLGYAIVPMRNADFPGVTALRLTEPEIVRDISLVTVRGRADVPAIGALVHEVMRLRPPDAALTPVHLLDDGSRAEVPVQ
jgi:LysR family hydrogen peroxide-inducible transcriptional activator